ncbi:putative DNA-binding pseudobarrel domain superfamily [Helianthus anomalus]
MFEALCVLGLRFLFSSTVIGWLSSAVYMLNLMLNFLYDSNTSYMIHMELTIKDSAGQTWDVAIGTEFSQGCTRYNVTGMREFVRDKQLVYGSQFQLIYVNVKVCCFKTE